MLNWISCRNQDGSRNKMVVTSPTWLLNYPFLSFFILFTFGSTGIWTLGLEFARQMLCHLSHAFGPFSFWDFHPGVLGIELRALHLVDKLPTTSVIPPLWPFLIWLFWLGSHFMLGGLGPLLS
jgi:prepilin signal peptidase PulO-like enzyme (type II secretory pathway)